VELTVLKFCRKGIGKILKNYGTVQFGVFSTFYFQKIALNQRGNIFHSVNCFVLENIHFIWEKYSAKKLNQNGGQNPKFQQKYQLAGFKETTF
jgi:hypothetical protein